MRARRPAGPPQLNPVGRCTASTCRKNPRCTGWFRSLVVTRAGKRECGVPDGQFLSWLSIQQASLVARYAPGLSFPSSLEDVRNGQRTPTRSGHGKRKAYEHVVTVVFLRRAFVYGVGDRREGTQPGRPVDPGAQRVASTAAELDRPFSCFSGRGGPCRPALWTYGTQGIFGMGDGRGDPRSSRRPGCGRRLFGPLS